MKKKFSLILISVILAVAMLFTSVACSSKKDPDKDNPPVTSGDSSSTGSNTGGDVVDPIEPIPSDPNTPEDRSEYSVGAVEDKIGSLYVKDLLFNGNESLSAALEGVLFGDVYGDVLDTALLLAASQIMPGYNVNLDSFDFSVYRGIDGNWYKKNSKVRVNGCLNEILNYKLDGTGTLDINYSLYGEKTLAEVFLDYSKNADTSDMKNYILSAIFEQSPVIKGFAYMTVNDVRTLANGTYEQKEAAIVKNFGNVKLSDIAELVGKDTGNADAFTKATLNLTVSEYFGIKNAETTEDALVKIAKVYKGVQLGDVFKITDGDIGYIKEFYTMTIGGLCGAAVEGTLSEYVLSYVGKLTLNEVLKAYVDNNDEQAKADYAEFYNAHKATLDLSINDVIEAYKNSTLDMAELETIYNSIKDKVVYGTVTIDQIVQTVIKYVQTGNDAVAGFDYKGFIQDVISSVKNDFDPNAVKNQVETVVKEWLASKGVTSDAVTEYLKENYAQTITDIFETVSGKTGEALDALLEQIAGQNLDEILADVSKVVYDEAFEVSNALRGFVDNYGDVLLELARQNSELNEALNAAIGKDFNEVLNEVFEILQSESIDVSSILKGFVAYYEEVLVELALQHSGLDIQPIIDRNTVTNADGTTTVNYEAVLAEIAKTYGKEMLDSLNNEVCKGLEKLKLAEDKAIYSYVSDTDGNVFDITVNEVITVLQAAVKKAGGLDGDIQGAVSDLLGEVKVSTIEEIALDLLFQMIIGDDIVIE